MKTLTYAATALFLTLGAANAQTANDKSDSKQASPGTTGAMSHVNSNGVATDPGGVQAQQGRSASEAPGTVGAAPGSDSPGKMDMKKKTNGQ